MSNELVKTDYISQSEQARVPHIKVQGYPGAHDHDFYMGRIGAEKQKEDNIFEVQIPTDTDKNILVGLGKVREWHLVSVPEAIRNGGMKAEKLVENALRSIRCLIKNDKEQ
jgi:hypothetical protein